MYELPPILQGSEREQLSVLRDYLVRLAQNLDENIARSIDNDLTTTVTRVVEAKTGGAVEQARSNAQKLRSLIVKTANEIHHDIDVITQTLQEEYLAISDFGTYQKTISAEIEQTASGIVESYNFAEAIQALDDEMAEAATYLTGIRGEIRRGLITDPKSGETAMGIAIAEELSFTGEEVTQDGLVYYELESGQTLGIYTATGWQFWINGSKSGWFDSHDGMLHTAQIAVEQSLTLGNGWVMTASGGFGIRYVGS